ncbi:MAG: DNA alkylation repair protein [Patescibacteria group bacterium]|nr:DNA alkylation repair protein [Patescibacteria group bacterium]
MNIKEIIKYFKSVGTERNRQGQARFGIDISRSLGVSQPEIRSKAKEIKRNLSEKDRHGLALKLWDLGYRETMLLAAMIDVPELVTKKQMDKWVRDFNSWDVCDTTCGDLLDKTSFAVEKALEYANSEKEFVKRTGFVLMAWLSVHNKELSNKIFVQFLKIIKNSADDERNFVKKAVNWALRQIGKSRNVYLYKEALKVADDLRGREGKTERWVGSNAHNELVTMEKKLSIQGD